jgi:hypothetical protein
MQSILNHQSSKGIDMKKTYLFAMAFAVCFSAGAQERNFLPKAEIEAIVSGKKWTFARQDGSKISWDMRSNGNLFGNNRSNGRSDAGTWAVNEQGQLCTTWRGTSMNACYVVFKDAEKFKRALASDVRGAADELTIE